MKTKSKGWWRCLPSRPCGVGCRGLNQQASLSFSFMPLAAFLPPKSCCTLDYEAAQACTCGLGSQRGGMSVAQVPRCLAALASSSMCLKQSHVLLRESPAPSCPKVFHSGGRARMCCLFDQLHCLNKLIADGVSGCGITADTCRHFPHQLVSLKAPRRLQSRQPRRRAICLALPAPSPPGDKYLESGKPAGARRSPR